MPQAWVINKWSSEHSWKARTFFILSLLTGAGLLLVAFRYDDRIDSREEVS